MTVRPVSRGHRSTEPPGWWCTDCERRVDGPWHQVTVDLGGPFRDDEENCDDDA